MPYGSTWVAPVPAHWGSAAGAQRSVRCAGAHGACSGGYAMANILHSSLIGFNPTCTYPRYVCISALLCACIATLRFAVKIQLKLRRELFCTTAKKVSLAPPHS